MWQLTLSLTAVLLLASNIWLLRELERLRRQLDAYQREVASLDGQVCRLMYEVEEVLEREPEHRRRAALGRVQPDGGHS
ncbi:MAG TPA: hypothetical protein VF234_08300 [Limnochordia bacterium]